MSVQAPPGKLSQTELTQAISEFVSTHNVGYLGTVGDDTPRVSPVRYFNDDDMNIYIHSLGGSKFDNLAHNQNTCLLVCSDFMDDFRKIKGVQIFGRAAVADPGSSLFEMAEDLCPWDHTDDVRLIKIETQEIIYVDSLSGEKIKQRWTK